MKSAQLTFAAPYQVEIEEQELLAPGTGEVLVATELSAISAGSEMLIYRGQFPPELALDDALPALQGNFAYPVQYGYALVGRVMALGEGVAPVWQDRHVFAFHPHASHFTAQPGELFPLPEDIASEDAIFLPNMETAVNLVMDGHPRLGEAVVIFGQGVVGLLTTALLADFPLEQLIAIDRYPRRCAMAQALGATLVLSPENQQALDDRLVQGADLVFELSGAPATLDQAIAATGYAGRVVVGSWYGQKRANLNLGGRFHRNRIQIVSSQVSTIAPELSGRWSKARRFELAWKMLRRVQPSRLITHRFPFTQAGEAYRLLDQQPANCLQVVLKYSEA